MKTSLSPTSLPRMASLAVAVLLTATVSLRAQTTPVGVTWDVVLHGSQKGVAQITFNADFTIDGTEVITVRPRSALDTDAAPRPGIFGGQRVTGGETNGPSTNIYFFGTSPLGGIWTFDNSGTIIGILLEGDDTGTNGISFHGRRRGDRLNLVGSHQGRTIHYRGVPITSVADMSGNFYATGQKNGEPFMELFTLYPDVTQNQYIVTGTGPAYDFVGVALFSVQNNVAITSVQSIGTNGVLSAVSGPFSLSKGRGSLTGVDEINSRVTSRVRKQTLP